MLPIDSRLSGRSQENVCNVARYGRAIQTILCNYKGIRDCCNFAPDVKMTRSKMVWMSVVCGLSINIAVIVSRLGNLSSTLVTTVSKTTLISQAARQIYYLPFVTARNVSKSSAIAESTSTNVNRRSMNGRAQCGNSS